MTTPHPLPGHPQVARIGDALHVEGHSLATLAATHGTPLFVYSTQWMLDALAAYQRGFIEDWLQRALYFDAPAWVFVAGYSLFAGLVMLSWAWYPPRRRMV